MFIIVNRAEWFGLEVIMDCYNKPKQFFTESEAIDFASEKKLEKFQIIEVNI